MIRKSETSYIRLSYEYENIIGIYITIIKTYKNNGLVTFYLNKYYEITGYDEISSKKDMKSLPL